MSIESGRHELDSADVLEPTQKLVAVAREKYIQGWQRGGNQAVSQSILSTTHDLSVVVPTRNERENIWPLVESLHTALRGLRVEVIFVDDSDDDTPDVIEDAARTMSSSLFQIQLKHRLAGEARAGGLATAVVAGLNRAQAAYVAVLDADLQHPSEQLRVLYDQAVAQHVDLVVASRYIKGGSYQGLTGVGRRCISVGLKWTAKLLFPGHLLRLSDPLGGFFLLRRALLADVSLRPIGYKILLELLLRCPWRQVLEVPYQFQARAHGQSKATMQQGIQALRHMLRLWREVPAAGRIWKISLLLLLNVLIILALLNVNQSFLSAWVNLNSVVFSVMACLDFVLFNRFIFLSPIVTSSVAASVPSVMSIEESETVELPAAEDAITNGHHPYALEEDIETVELPAAVDAITNGHHPPSIEDIETVKLPSAVDAIANGSHPPSSEEGDGVEPPAPEPVE